MIAKVIRPFLTPPASQQRRAYGGVLLSVSGVESRNAIRSENSKGNTAMVLVAQYEAR